MQLLKILRLKKKRTNQIDLAPARMCLPPFPTSEYTALRVIVLQRRKRVQKEANPFPHCLWHEPTYFDILHTKYGAVLTDYKILRWFNRQDTIMDDRKGKLALSTK
ncbi:hypothetical protein M514_05282 [Trichuris suis]|uniref:Uncharacterized protein n=1 Tax=Trichuris suis TaxID=68888 RepID=A0A085M980_9BILA|nr:hypothetical protein M513_05282 [Trichuris suis]KFD71573.1 hypothetical protein M514_05282 [Trichuris suis]